MTSATNLQPTLTFSCRTGLRRAVDTYTLTPTHLSGPRLTAPLTDLASIRLYTVPGMIGFNGIVARPERFCLITASDGRSLRLHSPVAPNDAVLAANAADFLTFVDALLHRTRAANPAARVLLGMPRVVFWSWLLTFTSLVFVMAIILVFGTIGMIQQHTFGWPAVGFDLALLVIATPALLFCRATWRRRSQSAGPSLDRLWQRADRA